MCVNRLRNGETVIGTMIGVSASPAVVRIAKNAGLDYVMLDMEHGPASYETLAYLAAVSGAAGIGCFVRVPELSRGYVSRALDCGADGVMVPMIETVEQARMLAGWAKYPPVGKRGLGSIGGHTGYVRIGEAGDFMGRANVGTITIAQIETVRGVESAGEIAVVDGIDALLVGPLDLSVSLGIPGRFDHPALDEAIGRVAAGARSSGKIFGLHAGGTLLETWVRRGARLAMNSLDTIMLSEGMEGIRRWFDGIK